MNDCITSVEDAVKDRLLGLGIILIMLMLVLCLVSPILDPIFKHHRRRAHIMNENYEELADRDMMVIRPILWGIAIVGWILVIINH